MATYSALSPQMKAVLSKGTGAVVETTARPKAEPGKCIIRVAAAGVNPTDWKHVSRGVHYYSSKKASASDPVGVGSEGCGRIEEVSEGSQFQVGQNVWYMCNAQGGFAEYVAVKESCVGEAPKQADMKETAGAPIGFLTAYQGLRMAGYSEAGSGAGKRALIHAGAGGVGMFGVQLAKIYGFQEIVATCSEANADFVKQLGATSTCDYRKKDFVEVYQNDPFDVVLDMVGGEPIGCCCYANNKLSMNMPRSRKVTKKSGTTVGIITGSSLDGAPAGDLGAICCSLLPGLCSYKVGAALGCSPGYQQHLLIDQASAGKDLDKAAAWYDTGEMRTAVAKTYSLDEFQQALDALEELGGHNVSKSKGANSAPLQGKVILLVDSKQ
mmetsp:Transcript_25100/g.45411  ORF Transcript_25100/g.45411 Transcript_25100/m.45411 type:complete len:382 (-) Transcript_25100:94-1239(-)